MRDFPSCFSETGVQVAEKTSKSGKTAQNLVTCVYTAQLSGRSCAIIITWSKHRMGHGLSIGVDASGNRPLCKVDIKPWMFSNKKGSKRTEAEHSKVDVFWDLSKAKSGSGPEPAEGFYIAVLFDFQIVLLLGDLIKEAYLRTNSVPLPSNAVFVARREHIFGKKIYSTRAPFCYNGGFHDIAIGLKDGCLEIWIDGKRAMQVKRFLWKFRGNQRIVVDGLPVEVFWDAHDWLFDASVGNAVFMFQSRDSAERPWIRSSSQMLAGSELPSALGFSLILYAWKSD